MNFTIFQFPLSGSLADLLLVYEWLITFLSLELALTFLFRVNKYKKELRSLQEKAYIWLFLGFSFMWMFFIISDYYVETSIVRLIFLNCGYISLMTSVLIFIYIIESYKIFIIKYFFTVIFSLNIIAFFLILIINIDLTQFISFTFWPIFVVFFIFYSFKLYSIFKRNPVLGRFIFKYLSLLFGIILFIAGFGLTTDLMIINFGLIMRMIGDIVQTCAIIFLFLFFISTPSFSEYEWQQNLDSLFIIHKSGLLIFQKSFVTKDENLYESSISGKITSLKMMLEGISNKEEFSVIEQPAKLIIIQPGKYLYGALISKGSLISIRILLKNLIENIEKIYASVLKDWKGDLRVFKPINKIVKDHFF
ncbi:MAG: hypothetical protein ACFFAQ_06685 [Promethearchaeota archaeon]